MPKKSTPSARSALRGAVELVAAYEKGCPGEVNWKILHHKLPKAVSQLADDDVIFRQKAVVGRFVVPVVSEFAQLPERDEVVGIGLGR